MGVAREAEDQWTHQKQSAYCLMPRLNVDLPFIAASVEITLPSTGSPWYSKQRQSKLTPNIHINIHLNLHKIYTEEAVISTLINILQST